MKKIGFLSIIIGIVLSILAIPIISVAYAFTVDDSTAFAATISEAPQQNTAFSNVQARAMYVVDFNTGAVILEKDATKRYPIASMVKIMTLLMTFNAIDEGRLSFNDKIIISDYAGGMGGSQMFLDKGAEYTVNDLIKGVTVCSANDAATALGEKIGGSIDNFVGEMNSYAKSLGMNDTLFCNATGLPNSGEQYSSAKDVTTMMRQLLHKSAYYNYSKIWLEDYTHADGRKTQLANTNKLIRFYKHCDAGKTGYTDEAKYCLSATAKSNSTRVVATVLGEPDSKTRFREVTDIFNYCFANYETKVIIRKGEPIQADISVEKAKKVPIELYCDNDLTYFGSKKATNKDYRVEFTLAENIKAPLKQNSSLGEIRVVDNQGNIVARGNILNRNEIPKKTYFDAINEVLFNWFVK